MFRAISKLKFGDEDMHNLLREQAIQWLLLPTNKQTMLPFLKGILFDEGLIGAADEIDESEPSRDG